MKPKNLVISGLFMTGESNPDSTPAMSRKLVAEAPRGAAQVLSTLCHMMASDSSRSISPESHRSLKTTATGEQQPQ